MPSRWAALALWGWLGCAAAWAAGRNGPLTTAELLVDLARDYGLMCRGRQTAADVEHVRTLLRAALRLDPGQTQAHAWLYELALLRGDRAEAGRMLSGLLQAEPLHEGAFARWLEAGARAPQTAEQRVQWLEAVAATQRPPGHLALVHAHLAQAAFERLDLAAARARAARALELEPCSPEAAHLALLALDEDADPAARLRAALRVLALRPLAVEAAWHVARLLDDQGLAEPAERFYDHALEVHQALEPGQAAPGALLLDVARNRAARGRPEEAVPLARQVIARDPLRAAEAGIFLYHLLDHAGRRDDAATVREELARRFAPLRAPDEWPVNEVAQAAWFHCTIDPQPDRALMLIRSAADRAPADRFVQRVLGWALALNLHADEARRTLAPLAGRDPWAAYMLARLLRESGDDAGARRVLADLAAWPAAGPALERLRTLAPEPPAAPAPAASGPASQPAPPTGGLVALLAEFDARVLEFHRDPPRFLDARITMEDRSPAPGEPWWAEFALTNIGPFPITLGPDAMVNPVFVLSFTLEGDRQRAYPALLSIHLDAARVLRPGQTVRIRRTLDVGPVRQISRLTPQQMQRVTVEALLDARCAPDGTWHTSPAGQRLRPVYFNRLPAATSPAAIAALFDALTGESEPRRWLAVEVVAELLGESQQAARRQLGYRPEPVPAERLRAALLNLLGSASWERRVRTLDALQMTGLDSALAAAVEACLEHPHWLVRCMALRLLARQGPALAARAADLAAHDEDELVRALADSYVQMFAGSSDK